MRLRRAGKGKVAAKRGDDSLSREEAPGLVGYWMTAVVGVALVLFLATAVGVFVWMDKDASDSRRKLESCVGMLVRDLANRAMTLQAQLRALSVDPGLRQALRTGDAGALLAAEEHLVRLIPSALRVRLVDTRYRGVEESDAQPLSYAGLDLINQVEREGRVLASMMG